MATAAVDWVGLGELGFSRVVEVVIKRRWAGAADVHAPDGRGGDGGVDVLAVDQNGRRRVYQIKFFPDGFSGDRKTTRQKQIRKSFDRALKLTPPPYEWILVVPKTLTPGERSFVMNLATDGGPKITIWDSDDLDELIATMPDIYNYLVRDALEDLLKKYALETAPVIADAEDLTTRFTNLRELASSLNPNWGVDMKISGQTVEYALRPKHPSAAEDDPITARFGVEFGPDDDAAATSFRRSMGFGARGSVRLPPHVVTHAEVKSSHPLFNSEIPDAEVILEARSRIGSRQAEFRFIDSAGNVSGTQDAVLVHANSGYKGGSMAFRILDCIEVEVDFEVATTDDDGRPTSFAPGGPMRIGCKLSDLYPDEVVRCIDFLHGLTDREMKFEVLIEGQKAFVFTSDDFELDDDLINLAFAAYDLSKVQEELHQRFKMPTEISVLERIRLRVARALLEGYFVESPQAANLNLSLEPDQIRLAELEKIFSDGIPVDMPMDSFSLKIGGRVLSIAGVRAATGCAKFVDEESLREAVNARQPGPFPAVMRPAAHRYFLLYKEDRIPEEEGDRQQAWWSLPGIEQPGEPNI